MSIATKAAEFANRKLRDQPASDFNGVAVMALPTERDQEFLAQWSAVKPEHLHCTLYYLGDGEEANKRGWSLERIVKAIEALVKREAPKRVKLGGITRFNGGPDGDPIVLAVSSPELDRMRGALVGLLNAHGMFTPSEHGYTPHMTVGYVNKDDINPIKKWTPEEVIIDRIRIGHSGKHVDIPLMGAFYGEKAALLKCEVCGKSYAADGPEDIDAHRRNHTLQEKVRHVRDTAYWGLPYGTPIIPGMKPNPQPELPLGVHNPLQDAEPRDRRRVLGSHRRGPELSAQLRAAKEEWDRISETVWDDWKEADEVKDKFRKRFGIYVENEFRPLHEGVASEGGWVQWNECRAIRQAAWELLGYNSDNGEQTRSDPSLHYYTPQSFRTAPEDPWLAAMILLDGIKEAYPEPTTFYRGVKVDDPEEFIKDLKEGMTFDMPLASFTDNREQTERFGTDITFVLTKGSKGVKGGSMGAPPNMDEDHPDYWDIIEDEDSNYEYVSGGRFKITGVRKNREGYTVIIRQQSVFNPVTGLLEKKDDVVESVPSFDWMFNFPLRTKEEEEEQKDVYGGLSGIGVSPAGLDGISRKHPGKKKPRKSRHDMQRRPQRRSVRSLMGKKGYGLFERASELQNKDYRDEAPRDPKGAWIDTVMSLAAVREVRMKTNLSHDDPKVVKFVKLMKAKKKFLGYIKVEKTSAGDLMIDGHHRLLAAELAGITEVPVRIYADTAEGRAAAHEHMMEGKVARDGDGDGFIYDGTPRQRPAPIGTPVVGDLTYGGISKYGKDYHLVKDKHGGKYVVGPDEEDGGFFAAGEKGMWDDLAVEQAATRKEALELLDARTRQKRPVGAKPVQGSLSDNPTKINMPKRSSTEREADAQQTRSQQAAAAKKQPAKRVTALKKPSVAKTTGKRPSAAKKAQSTAKRAAAVKQVSAKKKINESLKKSGGDLTIADKDGKEITAKLISTKPANAGRIKTVKKATKQSRLDPGDYHMRNGKPVQTEALRIQAHLDSGGSQRAVELAKERGQEFRLAPARDNEHLWFPKDPNSPIAFSYRQQAPLLDKDGKQVYKEIDGKKVPQFKPGEFGKRMTVQKKAVADANKQADFEKVVSMMPIMYKLDTALQRDAQEDPVAGAVMLMRQLGIRPNTQNEEAQAKNLANKSPLKARALRARGIDPTQPIFGATSIRREHVKVKGNKVEIEFMGKEHVWNTHVTDDPDVVAMIKSHMKGKSAKQPLFDGVDASKTQKYIQQHLGPAYTNKNLRTFAATQIASELISARPAPKTQEEFDIAQAEIAAQVALTLNNAAKQALSSYIATPIWKKWKDGIK